ncbi:unnamed protein product [marine sediment metagenome]|uniref:DUF4406 domain-containing protein n=1 Tax=marine sediment metagenome TaxID=412755 RepID=X0TWM7_9ZZZZ
MAVKVVYVAGAYRAETEWGVVQNIRHAEAVALDIWKLGAMAICPHKNTAHFGGTLPDEVWLQGDLELVRRSDAVCCVAGWDESRGARGEVALARQLSIPVFFSTQEVQAWLSSA